MLKRGLTTQPQRTHDAIQVGNWDEETTAKKKKSRWPAPVCMKQQQVITFHLLAIDLSNPFAKSVTSTVKSGRIDH